MRKSLKKIVSIIMAASISLTLMVTNVNVFADNKDNDGAASSNGFKESKNIWVIGDSIASDHDIDEANEVQITGWGNVLQQIVPNDNQ